ncbi:hypothetical protein FHU10_1146 [Serratia fonticola]|uniref:Uncharacterized protein n=1 Tax=Serratia fonticola TaxID=47917 RepID=A0A542D7Z6_SERFO|nr:hypothetical protein FHU11_4747 [Serratia fonticola]TVZ68692.1 hypothetical protein FHU10_1146 [Serratia fonticola]
MGAAQARALHAEPLLNEESEVRFSAKMHGCLECRMGDT